MSDARYIPIAHSFWMGPALGPIEAACLKSFAAVEQRIILHCYDAPANVPANVELADASLILPRERIIRHRKTGSLGLFADYFRYRLLRSGAELWVDCDVFALKPIVGGSYLFGCEADNQIAVGVLALPSDAPLLIELLSYMDGLKPPPWLHPRYRRAFGVSKALRLGNPMTHMPWGTYGPAALDYLAKKHGVADRAMPPDVFYPVPYHRLQSFLDPELTIDELTTSRTVALHLYTATFNRQLSKVIPTGSPLAVILDR